ncbi:hypothetical protein FSP39_009404 [Pinctada imbricata]|uniref:Uncharacterized protein n=1 Tax=Pinctada imbricata TaxID=66713 RepID=A0AA89C298_PINIB|nr:hypothetical protein FSP39_009404 [Pinctada imbricata]
MGKEEMAGTLTLSPDELTTVFLQCKICTKIFDDDENHPRLLPCLHTVCFECVKSHINGGKITCPVCKEDHQAKPDNLNATLPRDNSRRDLYDFVRVKRAPSAVGCTGCGKNMAEQRCKECAEFLCKECENAHMRVSATKNHTLIRLDSLKQSTSMSAFCQPQMCPDHTDKVLELYCSKESCMKPVCMMCAIVTCSTNTGHKINTCGEVASRQKEHISSLLEDVREVGSDVRAVTDSVSAEIVNVRNQHEGTLAEIDDTFNALQEIIERGRQKMKENVKSVTDKKIGVLEQQKECLREHTKRIKDSMDFSEQALTHTNAPAFLQIEKTVADRLDYLKNKTYDREPYKHATFGFHREGLTNDVQKCIERSAKIWTASVYLPRTKFTIPKEPMQNEAVSIEIDISDNRGNAPVNVNDLEAFTTVAEDPSGSKTDCRLTAKSDRQLQASFTPKDAGKFKIELKILDKVVGSYVLDVKPSGFNKGTLRGSTEQKGLGSQRGAQSTRRPVPPPPTGKEQLTHDPERPDITFDIAHAHKDVSVSPDGKMFQNWSTDGAQEMVPNNSRLQRYKGAVGNFGFQHPGTFFYEMHVDFKVKKPLDKSNLVFEIGIARKSSIGTKLVVSGEKFAWSMIAAHHTECDAICLHIANGSHILHHQKLAENKAGCALQKNFCLLSTRISVAGKYKTEVGNICCAP